MDPRKLRESISLVIYLPNVCLPSLFALRLWQMCQGLEKACSFARRSEPFAQHFPLDGTLICGHQLSYTPSCLQIHPVPNHHVRYSKCYFDAVHSHTLKLQVYNILLSNTVCSLKGTRSLICEKCFGKKPELMSRSPDHNSRLQQQGWHPDCRMVEAPPFANCRRDHPS